MAAMKKVCSKVIPHSVDVCKIYLIYGPVWLWNFSVNLCVQELSVDDRGVLKSSTIIASGNFWAFISSILFYEIGHNNVWCTFTIATYGFWGTSGDLTPGFMFAMQVL
jgi:hypothetical protein